MGLPRCDMCGTKFNFAQLYKVLWKWKHDNNCAECGTKYKVEIPGIAWLYIPFIIFMIPFLESFFSISYEVAFILVISLSSLTIPFVVEVFIYKD